MVGGEARARYGSPRRKCLQNADRKGECLVIVLLVSMSLPSEAATPDIAVAIVAADAAATFSKERRGALGSVDPGGDEARRSLSDVARFDAERH